MTEQTADRALLMWDTQRNLRWTSFCGSGWSSSLSPVRAQGAIGWLVAQHSGTDLCVSDPGFGVDLRIDAEPRAIAEVSLGRLTLGDARRASKVRVSGR